MQGFLGILEKRVTKRGRRCRNVTSFEQSLPVSRNNWLLGVMYSRQKWRKKGFESHLALNAETTTHLAKLVKDCRSSCLCKAAQKR